MANIETATAVASILTACATTVTMCFLVWYTIETHKLRVSSERQNQIGLELSRAARHQNELASMPIVILQIRSQEWMLGVPLKLAVSGVRNIGKGAAFNVVVDPIREPPFEVRFAPIVLLETSDQAALDFTIWNNSQTSGFSRMTVQLESLIESGHLGQDKALAITYSDSSGKRYRSSQIVRFNAASREVITEFETSTN